MSTVLVVEDDEQLIELYSKKLKTEGFTTYVARDGKEGLSIYQKRHPDIILLDILMPQMDGISMLKKLRGFDDAKDIPVIILTNLAYSEKLPEIKELFQEYIIKAEVSLDHIVEVIKKYTTQ